MKKIYLFIYLFSIYGWSQTTIFSENIGPATPTGTIEIANNVFQNSTVTFTGNADTRTTVVSTGYTGASGGRNVFFGTGSSINNRNFIISGINTSNYNNIELSFGMVSPDNFSLLVEYSTNGIDFTAITFSNVNAGANWKLITIPTGVIPSTTTLTLRFSKNDATTYRVDDIVLKGTALSSDNFDKNNNISLYPNPTYNGNVSFYSDLSGNKNIKMYDISGREVLDTNISENNFNVNGLNSGVYMVKITSENKSYTSKLIIK